MLGFPPSDCNFFCDNIWKAAQEIHLCRFYLLGRFYGDAAWRECPHGADGEDGGHLVRNGSVGPIAIAAFATGFISYWWLTLDMGPAKAGLRAEPRILANSNMTQPKFVNSGTAVSLGQEGYRARLASLGGNEPDLTFEQPDHRSEPPSARAAYVERFSLYQPLRPSVSFGDRFFGEIPPSSAPAPSVAAASSTTLRRVSAAAMAPRPIVRSRVAQATPKPSEPGFRLCAQSFAEGFGFSAERVSRMRTVLALALATRT